MKTRNNLVKVHGLLMDDDRVVLEGVLQLRVRGHFFGTEYMSARAGGSLD